MRQQLLQQLRALPTLRQESPDSIPLESEPFHALFPEGIRRGTLTEWLGEQMGSGAESLALKLVSELRGTLIVVDSQRDFYPPAAAALGVSLSNTILVRPPRDADSLWAIEQTLRCRGAGVVLTRLNHLESRAFRRLQLAAEHGGTIGVLIRPASQRASPSWAQARFLVRALPSRRMGRRLEVESLHSTGTNVVELELNDATGAVCLVSRLADSAAARRAAGA
jgi:protein ImuA